MTVCVVGATGGVGEWLIRAVLGSDDFDLHSAVARTAAGQDIGVALGDDPCGIIVLDDIEEALEDKPDVIIDYTHPSVRMQHAMATINHSIPAVIGTTGFTAQEFDQIDKAARDADVGLVTGNMSLTATATWARSICWRQSSLILME